MGPGTQLISTAIWKAPRLGSIDHKPLTMDRFDQGEQWARHSPDFQRRFGKRAGSEASIISGLRWIDLTRENNGHGTHLIFNGDWKARRLGSIDHKRLTMDRFDQGEQWARHSPDFQRRFGKRAGSEASIISGLRWIDLTRENNGHGTHLISAAIGRRAAQKHRS
jgi:hypothetical protein